MVSSLKKLLSSLGLGKLTKKTAAKINFNLKRSYFGKKFIIPIINNLGYDNLVLYDGLWKKDFFENLLKFKDGMFLDIGVNIGQTLILLRSFNDKIKYIGFEPNSACVFYVNHLVQANNIRNSIIIPAGIYNENKIVSFNIQGDSDQAGTIVENLRPGEQYIENVYVPVFDFDTLSNDLNINEISLIKIDVEGAELGVLTSLKNCLVQKSPVVVCEILWAHNESKLKDNEERNKAIMELMNEVGYSVYQIIKDEQKSKIKYLKKISKLENKVYSNENREECDYLMIENKFEDTIKTTYKIS